MTAKRPVEKPMLTLMVSEQNHYYDINVSEPDVALVVLKSMKEQIGKLIVDCYPDWHGVAPFIKSVVEAGLIPMEVGLRHASPLVVALVEKECGIEINQTQTHGGA